MNEYLRQVEKELRLPRRKKQEVLRDLREIFESAREHGESEADVMERLGPAADYAAAVSVPLCGKRRSGFALPSAFLALAAALIAVFLAAQASRPADNIIGQADAMTQLRVVGGLDPAPLLLAAGVLAAVGAAVLFALRLRRRRREKP